ncbi:hypothetical protein BZA05DRAFT_181826 [Tricharina praecox]|uniref:uncharacterized protein n=1 Tax=Tricharina praecox TaxID=43433 RepID=UPI00221E83C0|nr:uncharacterized protein BZA05DRAFT_181826 [Tricharina praecox]KAI5843580.1 hypothetical protein BZA05DRAFT_181826 [Tricharina praecox]
MPTLPPSQPFRMSRMNVVALSPLSSGGLTVTSTPVHIHPIIPKAQPTVTTTVLIIVPQKTITTLLGNSEDTTPTFPHTLTAATPQITPHPRETHVHYVTRRHLSVSDRRRHWTATHKNPLRLQTNIRRETVEHLER